MPRCEGRPDGPCPDNRNDSRVRLSQGDLMLCEACELYRFPSSVDAKLSKSKKSANVNVNTDSVHSSSAESTRSTRLGTSTRRTDTETKSTAAPAAAGSHTKVVISEILAYITHYRNRSTADALRKCVIGYYPPSDISDAKKLIVNEFQSMVVGSSLLTERRDSTVRPAHEAELDDVLCLLDLLDDKNCLSSRVFVAANLDNIPKYGPEELNVASVVDRHAKLDMNVNQLTDDLHQLKQSMLTSDNCAGVQLTVQSALADMQDKFDQLHLNVCTRLDHFNTICSQFQVSKPVLSNIPSSVNTNDHDRSLNVIVFGVKEEKDITIWRRKVDDILKFVVGREVGIADMYRLGQFRDGKTRPILVKLETVWDRRLILYSCRKLASYPDRVFVSADEPIEVRRKQTFDRLQYRAGRNGKAVKIEDGVLFIDDVATFSLKDGFLTNTNGEHC